MRGARVSLAGLSRRYDEAGRNHVVLAGVDAEIPPGQFVVLVGRSGSGKSTLLNLIGGLDTPSGGTISIDGVDIFRLDETSRTLLRRRQVGFVFQFFNLVPTLNALENVTLPLELNDRPRRAAETTAREWLERIGLADRAESFPDELSGGEQQRVAIARALAHEPGLVLADEPTGNLDLATARTVLDLLDTLCRDAGVTLVMATHSPEVIGMADRILEIRDGTLTDRDPGDTAS